MVGQAMSESGFRAAMTSGEIIAFGDLGDGGGVEHFARFRKPTLTAVQTRERRGGTYTRHNRRRSN